MRRKILLSFFLFCTSMLFAQFNPHKEVDYTETYRGQYHFSPPSAWMNDINGLVYQGGKYHMIYQWAKCKGKENKWYTRHGGYATSPDLLHWNDQGIALIPQHTELTDAEPNVECGQVYSGSAVVVSGKTAEKITGSEKEAIIAIYTGTGVGTCLAWSNDTGKTWNDYTGNPVANPTNKAYPRDPCVIWHEPTKKWVMALYENGTTFYGSKNLIDWKFMSNLNFGYECPDLYQLPVDGDQNNKKWVLQDANGSYLVGEFDGKAFTTDKGQKTHLMDVGPDFYAAQSFPKGNLPGDDPRIIQIAWMDHWNGGIGETVWERNATFPVSLGLVTYNGQKRLTRQPIKEITKLYHSKKTWENTIISPDTNILSGIKSNTFDLTAEFDLTGSKATFFGFIIDNKPILYDVDCKNLLYKELNPDKDGHVKIRILVDWGQLEVFANNGIFSYTQQFPFTPDVDHLELYTDEDVKLVKMTFHEIERIW